MGDDKTKERGWTAYVPKLQTNYEILYFQTNKLLVSLTTDLTKSKQEEQVNNNTSGTN